MVLGLKKLFKGGSRAPASLSDDALAALERWRASPAPALDEPHYLTRYVVVDISTSGPRAEEHELLGISAVAVQGGAVLPDDAFAADIDSSDTAAVDRQLLAFLDYAAKAPLVTYQSPFAMSFLRRIYGERLGLDFQPPWIDLAWLLPSLFPEKGISVAPLDDWLERCGIDTGAGRRDSMANTLVLARLFQKLLVRANGKEILAAGKLVEESHAAGALRQKR